MVPCEKSEMVSFASSIMENIVVSSLSRLPAKRICCIAIRSLSSTSYYLGLLQLTYNIF